MGITVTSLVGYALIGWGPTYYIRSFGLTKLEIALYIAPTLAVEGVIGTVGGGKAADWCAAKYGLYAKSWLIAGAPPQTDYVATFGELARRMIDVGIEADGH